MILNVRSRLIDCSMARWRSLDHGLGSDCILIANDSVVDESRRR